MDRLLRHHQPSLLAKIIALGFLAVALFFFAKAILWGVSFTQTTGVTPGLLVRLAFDGGAQLDSSDGRTNILILGIGGGAHAGPDLTDTMMVVSINTKNHNVALISVPRDIWSDTLKDKVNSAYTYGEQKKKGGGMVLAKAITEDVVGLPIHYALVIDFNGFKNLIDEVGGIDVTVPDSFTDTQYPIDSLENATCPDGGTSCHYETVHFDAGLQHMDGARALIYARSRHAEGPEGSDFARSRRQQLIILALKDKLVHPTRWFTFTRLTALPKVIDDATDMDMNIGEALTVAKNFIGVKAGDIKRISFEDRLDNPPASFYNGLYVLVPHVSWDDIHQYIASQLP